MMIKNYKKDTYDHNKKRGDISFSFPYQKYSFPYKLITNVFFL